MALNLGDIQETMLIPLTCKANESMRQTPRIYDNKAVQIIKSLGIDTRKYDKFMTHEGVVARTILFDEAVKKYLKKFPDAVCVNVGCGLDNRFARVDNGKMIWYNLDLPDTMAVRKKFFKETKRERMIIDSILEEAWIKHIEKDKQTIFIMEGLLMYFTKGQVKRIFDNIINNFPHAIIIAELMHPLAAKGSKYHDTVKNTNATFKWGTKSGHEIEEICPRVKLVSEVSFNQVLKKYSVLGKIWSVIPGLRNMNDRLAIFEVI